MNFDEILRLIVCALRSAPFPFVRLFWDLRSRILEQICKIDGWGMRKALLPTACIRRKKRTNLAAFIATLQIDYVTIIFWIVAVRTPVTSYSGGPGGVFPSLNAMQVRLPGHGIYENHGFPPGSVNPAMAAHYRSV